MNIALVLSGGTGTRVGGDIPKQYVKINDRMIITFCLNMFDRHDRVDAIWVVAAEEWQPTILEEYKRTGQDTSKLAGFSSPGKTRQLSILNGLRDINIYTQARTDITDTDPVIIIHDAARPNLTAQFVNECLDAIEGYDGVMPVLPMKDTVYYSNDGIKVDRLLDRGRIFAGQAPEIYRLRKYLDANEQLFPDKLMKINGSTEPAVIAGMSVALIPGDENNYKITTRKDLESFMQSHQVFC